MRYDAGHAESETHVHRWRRLPCAEPGRVPATIFENSADHVAVEQLLTAGCDAVPVRLLAFCRMPNRWHLVLCPQADGYLSVFIHRLTMIHTTRWHLAHRSPGSGPLPQGRFKSFPVANDEHFLTVCRYFERNPLRANLVGRAENWRWWSLWHRLNPSNFVGFADWPIVPSGNWVERVNEPQTEAELAALHNSV